MYPIVVMQLRVARKLDKHAEHTGIGGAVHESISTDW